LLLLGCLLDQTMQAIRAELMGVTSGALGIILGESSTLSVFDEGVEDMATNSDIAQVG
jgi:hypothetical protein